MQNSSEKHYTISIDTQFLTSPFGECYLPEICTSSITLTPIAQQYEAEFGEYILQNNALYTIVGTDSGLFIDYIIEQGVPSGSAYLFIEFDNIIPLLGEHRIPTELAQKIQICSFSNWQDAAESLNIGNYIYARRNMFYHCLAAKEGSMNIYSELSSALEADLSRWVFLYNVATESRIFIDCQLEALQENLFPANALKDSCSGRTAVILAGGPSLNEFIPWYKQHCGQDKVLTIAVSRIAHRLQAEGIVPDIFISVDPQEVSLVVSQESLFFPKTSIFATSCALSSQLSAQWHGQQVYLGPRYPHETEKNPGNIPVIGPTVTNSAIELAAYMGANYIVLAGVDLCYNSEGHSHTPGSLEHDIGHFLNLFDNVVETNSGCEADTNRGYFEAIGMMAAQSRRLSSKECTLVTIAENGAKIDGINYIPLTELSIHNPFSEPVINTLRALLPQENDRSSVIDIYNEMIKETEACANDLEKITILAEEAILLNEDIFNPETGDINQHNKHRLKEIETLLSERYDPLCDLIIKHNAPGFSKALSGNKEDDEWTIDEVKEQMHSYYQALSEGATTLKSSYENANKQVQQRLAEEATPANIESLIANWTEKRIPGRGRVWKEKHQAQYSMLNDDQKILLEQQDTLFTQTLATITAEHKAKTFNNEAYRLKILSVQLEQIQQRFYQKDLTSLQRMQNALRALKNDSGLQLYHLVSGYAYELQSQHSSAATAYANVTTEPNWEPKQYALERHLMIAMELGDLHAASECLHQLSQKMNSYRPFYAQSLYQTGNAHAAIEEYTNYLAIQPRDLDAMTELGLVFKSIGNYEGLHWTREHIKALSPDFSRLTELDS